MSRRRRMVEVGCMVWAMTGAIVALAALPSVNDDVRSLVALASVGFPLFAVGAAYALHHERERLAGLLLLLSAATPTYFAYLLNLPALIVGIVLVVSPSAIIGHGRKSLSARP